MNEHHISKRLRQAVKTAAPINEVSLLVDEALATEDTHCAAFLRAAVDHAIRGHNTAALRVILLKCQECQPNVLRMLFTGVNSRQPLLLVLAVQTGNVEAVKMLLEFGANPNGDGVQFHFLQSPLRIAAISPRSEPFNRLDFDNNNNNSNDSDSDLGEEDGGTSPKSVSYEIIRLLLKYGADPLLHFSNGSGTIPLHFAPHLAVVCPDAAQLLLKSTPPSGYDCRFDWPPGSPNSSGMTPLSMALFEAYQAVRQNRNVANVFHSVIVPLLRSGAPLHPDPLSSPASFNDLVFLDSTVSTMLWPYYRHMVLRLVLEARWKAKLGSKSFKTLCSISSPANSTTTTTPSDNNNNINLINNPIDNNGNLTRLYADYVRSLYPWRLDHLCRVVILRQLPRGLAERQRAIDSFGLPRLLSYFLNFSEYEMATMNGCA